MNEYYRITTKFAVYSITTYGDKVINAAPIGKFLIGKNKTWALGYLEKKYNAIIEKILLMQ